jgi:hypothetical protein
MALAKIPNIIKYAEIGKERLTKAIRAIKTLKINGADPIAELFRKCGIQFDPENPQFEKTMTDIKLGIDKAVAISKIKKAEEKKSVELGVNADHIKELIDKGVSINSQFVADLFKINGEGRDVNDHLEGLCSENGDGDEMLPHIKKVEGLPKLVKSLKATVESIRQHTRLADRIKPDDVNMLENFVAELKGLVENSVNVSE